MPAETSRGIIDTHITILRRRIDPAGLPDEIAISAVTLAKLPAGVHAASTDDADDGARRIEVLQRTEAEFDPIPFDADAARPFGRISAAVLGNRANDRPAGRRPDDRLHRGGRRTALCTANPVSRASG